MPRRYKPLCFVRFCRSNLLNSVRMGSLGGGANPTSRAFFKHALLAQIILCFERRNAHL